MTDQDRRDQGNQEERLTRLLEAQQRARSEAEDALEYVHDIVGTLRESFLIMDESLQISSGQGSQRQIIEGQRSPEQPSSGS